MGRVVIEWECLKLTERNKKTYIVKAYSNAIYHEKYGWICDCGEWTKGDDEKHTALRFGNRECFIPKKVAYKDDKDEWEKTYYKSDIYPYPESFEPLSYWERLHDSQREELEYLKKIKTNQSVEYCPVCKCQRVFIKEECQICKCNESPIISDDYPYVPPDRWDYIEWLNDKKYPERGVLYDFERTLAFETWLVSRTKTEGYPLLREILGLLTSNKCSKWKKESTKQMTIF